MRSVLFSVLIYLVAVSTATADADGERSALAQLIHELEVLTPLVNEAKAQANPDARIRFQYDWLKQDLETIRMGINAHIQAPQSQPRTFPPLQGDYRR